MDSPHTSHRLVGALLALLLAVAACGGGSAAPDDPEPGGAASPSDLVARGSDLAQSSGCVACHGSGGEGTVGPAWQGLLGSTVTLTDGTTLAADEAYIRRSIVTPDADVVAGFTIEMPEVDLTPGEVDALVAYISSL